MTVTSAIANTAVFGGIEGITVDPEILHLFIAGALGMLLGLEREWANKSAGIRTFTLTSLVGAAAMSLDERILLALGGALVLVQGGLLGIRGIVAQWTSDDGD